jgi:phosphoribosyl 1,2-cyclic phosphate phosphodiesterase
MMLKVTLLGTGGSGGVPLLGGPTGEGHWGDCDPSEPRNRRSRTSCVVEGADGQRLLIDAGPDLRAQLLANRISKVQALVLTHAHADHIMGIDDLRQINRNIGDTLDCYGTKTTLLKAEDRFDYAFRPATPPLFFRPALEPKRVDYDQSFEAAGLKVTVFRQDHGVMDSLGVRVGGFAYSTDVVMIPDESMPQLQGLDTWVIGCFQHAPHKVHANLDQVKEWVARIRPRRTVLTHMGISMDFASLAAALPPGIEPGYDGMVLDVPLA